MLLTRYKAAFWLSMVCSWCLCGQVSAELDPEVKKPYTLQIVLHFKKHRNLTQVFQTQVKNELKDGLQAALGDLAQVDVVDLDELARKDASQRPLLEEAVGQGLQRALDSWNWLSDRKTHFVFIDFVDYRYDIQSRQYDGFTGLASPVVRHSQVDDRQLVSRQAALLVDKDFGVAGTLGKMEGDIVEVPLKAGNTGAALDHWIKKGDVLAVSQIVQGSRNRSLRLPWTLLQVNEEPRDGVCRCRLYYRRENPLPRRSSILGYRCLKLGATDAPLRVRLISDDERRPKPLAGREIRIAAKSFDEEPLDKQSTTPDGLMPSPTSQTYHNLAFVKIFDGGMALAQVPVEIIDDRTVTIPISDDPTTQQRGQLLRDRERWIRHLYDSLEAAAAVVKELNVMNKSPEGALAKAQAALKAIDADVGSATSERDIIIAESAKLGKPIDLSEGEKRIADLRTRRQILEQYVAKCAQIVKEEQDPKRREAQQTWERGRLLEKEAEFQQAITAYESVVAQFDDPKLRGELQKLKDAWQLHDEQHRRADSFIYVTWPKLQKAKEIRDNLAKAKEAFETCRNYRDVLRPRKLLKVNLAHTAKIENELEGLRSESEDDRKTAEIIADLADKLKAFSDQISDYLRKAKPADQ
jgi:predicted DNA-binding antitoxin AbrB/MazE fold protein